MKSEGEVTSKAFSPGEERVLSYFRPGGNFPLKRVQRLEL